MDDEQAARHRHPASFPQLASEGPPAHVVIVPDSEVAGMTQVRARSLLGSSSALFEAGRRAGRAEASRSIDQLEATLSALREP